MSSTPTYNDMQLLKRRMFAMRNGVIADVLRKAGSKFQIIFGLNLPQLAEIAADTPHSLEFAQQVWSNATTRESMLIAPMLMPHGDFSQELAEQWIAQVPEAEVADVLCLKLLRHMPYAYQFALSLIDDADDMRRYAGLRLMCNLAPQYPAEAARIGEAELKRNCPLTRQAASVLQSYADL